MEKIRAPFQGIRNIVRFNRHFYLLAFVSISIVLFLSRFLVEPYRTSATILCFLIVAVVLISLAVSFYVYDLSDLYRFNRFDGAVNLNGGKIVNIHAGFDETSVLLRKKFPNCSLQVFDFYDSSKHTEISIKRARKAYPAFPNTTRVSTSKLPLSDNKIDVIFVIFSAHEIRNGQERTVFFSELKRVLQETGKIILIEHLRDLPNFLAYNIGFSHFIPKSSWYETFKNSELVVLEEIKITPFVTTFILGKHGPAS